ncbi:hypothetical protein U9M48_004714 [Paspalum notatum var. saurae]|uniref:Uncharacterized protein n=1 Tax=Paspalum notatum var. saurae TaxID=547442 RepID=A0AAQ3PW46_PASNO
MAFPRRRRASSFCFLTDRAPWARDLRSTKLETPWAIVVAALLGLRHHRRPLPDPAPPRRLHLRQPTASSSPCCGAAPPPPASRCRSGTPSRGKPPLDLTVAGDLDVAARPTGGFAPGFLGCAAKTGGDWWVRPPPVVAVLGTPAPKRRRASCSGGLKLCWYPDAGLLRHFRCSPPATAPCTLGSTSSGALEWHRRKPCNSDARGRCAPRLGHCDSATRTPSRRNDAPLIACPYTACLGWVTGESLNDDVGVSGRRDPPWRRRLVAPAFRRGEDRWVPFLEVLVYLSNGA